MTEPDPQADLIEELARALAASHGLDFDEVCGVDAKPDEGECDSGTCIASGYEDHDATYARDCYRADARALLPIIAAREAAAYARGIEDAAAWVQANWAHDKRALVPAIRALKETRDADV